MYFLVQPPIAEPAPPAVQPPHPFVRRFYVLFNLQGPVDMLNHGVREFIVEQMRGRLIGGMILRSKLPDYGQCIIIRASGTRSELELFENIVLPMKAADGRVYWEYSKTYKPEEPLSELISHEFIIGQSNRGATRGPHSNPMYDNNSEKSSRTGKSSK